MIYNLALVSETSNVKMKDVTLISAAIQKQVSRDFAPLWSIQATLDPFEKLEDVPPGYWPVIIVEEVPGSGTHQSRDGQPYALVEAGLTWSLAASHEILEMLADPFGSRLVAGQAIAPDQGRVQYLVEVCDPCQDVEFAYSCNGFLVSDFFTPNYFDPVKVQNVRYSFTGAVSGPRQVLQGGCVSWFEPNSGHWFQLNRFGNEPELKNLGPILSDAGLRTAVDDLVPRVNLLSTLSVAHNRVQDALATQSTNAISAEKTAQILRRDVASKCRMFN